MAGCTYHLERKKGVELYKTVEITEDDRNREKHNVARVPYKESNKLDDLSEGEHEDKLRPEGIAAVCRIPVISRPPARYQEERVGDERQRGESREVQSIRAPWLLAV